MAQVGRDVPGGAIDEGFVNPPINIKGLVVGQLTALEFSTRKAGTQRLWKCICTCGGFHYAQSWKLRNGMVTKCRECWKKEARTRNATKRAILPDGRDRYEVAKLLGITPNAVQMRIDRGWKSEDAVRFGRRRTTIHVVWPCPMCGAKAARDPIRPWRSRSPVCRSCFIKWDTEQEALEYMTDHSFSMVG